MDHIGRLRQHIASRNVRVARVLLVFGGPLGHALGDTIIATNHYRFLKTAFHRVRLTVWTADTATWRTICGNEVRCNPFISKRQIHRSFDLIILDWVSFDSRVETLFSGEGTALISIPPGQNRVRYYLPRSRWTVLELPPRVNHSRRLHEVYGALGVTVESSVKTTRPVSKRPALYLNPYASSGEKCLDEALLALLLNRLPLRWKGGIVICPAVPKGVPASELPNYLRLDALVRAAARRRKVRRLKPMSRARYISTVSASRLVVGPDSSSQHIASVYGIPSIACYPIKSGYRYYRWGSPGRLSICLRTPNPHCRGGIASFAELIAHLAKLINGVCCDGASNAEVSARTFVSLCKAVATRTIEVGEGQKRISDTLRNIRLQVPRSWRQFVLPELEQICHEICDHSTKVDSRSDEISAALLADIYALKTLRVLGGVPSRTNS